MSSDGKPTVSNTITIVTRPADGMPAAPIEAAVAVTLLSNNKIVFKMFCQMVFSVLSYLTATNFPKESGTFRNCAMKIAATASYKAVPSIFTVAPTGMTKRVTRGSMPISSNVLIVTGIVAELNGSKRNMA